MELPQRDEARSWLGLPVLDERGNALGTCEQLYADESTGTPEWAVVGLEDGRRAFVPLVDATARDGSVHVTFDHALVASAPSFPDSGRLTPEQDIVLYRHYGVPYSTKESPTVLPTDEPEPDVPVQAGAPVQADLPVQPDAAPTRDVTVVPAAAGRLRQLDFGPPEDSTTDVEPEPVRPAAPAAAPSPVTPTQAVRPTVVPAPVQAAPAPGSGAEPAVLAGLAVAVALFGVLRALRSRRLTPAQRASRQLQAATTTASRTARAQSLAALRAALQAEAAATRALARAAQEGGRATRTGAVRSRQIARAGAVVGRRLAGTGAARGQELTRAAALRRRALAQAAAARRSQLADAAATRRVESAKAAANQRKEAAKAGAARRRQAAKDVAVRSKDRAGTRAAVGSSTRTVSRTTSRDRRTGGAAGPAPVRVARRGALRLLVATAHGGQRLRRSWRRNTRRLALGLGLAGGYVVGARAGEQRYEEIVQIARQLPDQPQVQSLRDRLPASFGGSRRAR